MVLSSSVLVAIQHGTSTHDDGSSGFGGHDRRLRTSCQRLRSHLEVSWVLPCESSRPALEEEAVIRTEDYNRGVVVYILVPEVLVPGGPLKMDWSPTKFPTR